MNGSTTIKTERVQGGSFLNQKEITALLVAHAPCGACTSDRFVINGKLTIGRSSKSELHVRNGKTSKEHCSVLSRDDLHFIRDLGSTNGTFVDGVRITGEIELHDEAVIRAGDAIFVFHKQAASFMRPPPTNRFGMSGLFHTNTLLDELADAARSSRHVLLVGPTGSGKELAARAYAEMLGTGGQALKYVTHNAARYTSEEEAASTLFGIGPRVFSGVDGRSGLIETANNGVLFLDEIHNLPTRVQRTLLRIIEDGRYARIGESDERTVSVRFVFASNDNSPRRGLASDLHARLREVALLPLARRVADIPSIFSTILANTLGKQNPHAATVHEWIDADHYEALCLDPFEDKNIRGLVDIADRIASQIAGAMSPRDAAKLVLGQHYHNAPVAIRQQESADLENNLYEKHKNDIIAAYNIESHNLSATERHLKSKGIPCSRRWVRIYLERWGVR